ncbi:MAG: Tar ligand binding domain-containing protein, partial [Methanoregulaceae archaeon]|nr:Tar ligand binding domain-containing protein [Methanoregulaceae archaeon]
MFKDITIKARLLILIGIFSITAALIGITGWQGLSSLNDQMGASLQSAQLASESINTARRAQVSFKIQVQEWKDTLLRGTDPAAFAKHQAGFEKQESAVQSDLATLKGLLEKQALSTERVEEMIQSHREMGKNYRAALTQYDGSRFESAQTVDKLVKGMDRKPTEMMNGIVKDIEGHLTKTIEQATNTGQASYH